MQFATAAHILGLVGLVPVRAFLPAFLTALAMRYGAALPLLGERLAADGAGAPTWFTHDYTLVVLGALSFVELFATKNEDARQILETIDQYYKPALTGLIAAGLITQSDAAAVEAMQGPVAGGLLPVAALSLGQGGVLGVVAVLAAGLTYAVATLRASLMEFVEDLDPDDSTGIPSLIAWAEDGWVLLAALLMVLMPVVVLALVAVALAGLWGLERMLERRDAKSRIPCAQCGEPACPHALACPKCCAPTEAPRAVGVLGGAKDRLVEDRKQHRLRLAAARRCPRCATRLRMRTTYQQCGACGAILCEEIDIAQRYLPFVNARMPGALVVCALLGAVPVLGLVPGIVYYRIVLVRPLRNYLGVGSGFIARWLGRIGGVLVIALTGWVPLLSAATVPVLAMVNLATYRRGFVRQLERDTARQRAGEAPAANPARQVSGA